MESTSPAHIVSALRSRSPETTEMLPPSIERVRRAIYDFQHHPTRHLAEVVLSEAAAVTRQSTYSQDDRETLARVMKPFWENIKQIDLS